MIEQMLQAFTILLVGMTGVFLSLMFFYAIILLLQKGDNKLNIFLVNKKLTPSKVESEINQIKSEIVAAIAAAAYETFHKPIKIKKIHFLDDSHSSQWATSGRINIMGSHNLKK